MNQAERYQALLSQTGKQRDPSYQAALYLLSYDSDLHRVCSPHVSKNEIDFDAIKQRTRGFDERERFVVDIANNLLTWTSKCKATPFEISRLGYPYTEMVYQAMQIANEQLQIEVVNRDGELTLQLDNSKYRQSIKIATLFGTEPLVQVVSTAAPKRENQQPSLAEFIAAETKKLSLSERLEDAKQQVAVRDSGEITKHHSKGHER